jgi:phage shock protein A
MGIFSRLSDIVNSNVTALLDHAEDPAKMIRLIIVEMEDTLVEVRAGAAKTIAEQKDVGRTLGRYRAVQDEWRRKAEVALAKGREDLSRAALLEKAKLGEEAVRLEEEQLHLDEGLAKAEEDIRRLEDKLKEARAKQKTMSARHQSASHRLKVRRSMHDGRLEDAFARFEQVEKRLDTIEGEVESYDLGRPRTLGDELAELESETAIEDELAEMKARMAGGQGGRA